MFGLIIKSHRPLLAASPALVAVVVTRKAEVDALDERCSTAVRLVVIHHLVGLSRSKEAVRKPSQTSVGQRRPKSRRENVTTNNVCVHKRDKNHYDKRCQTAT